jgi:hypothetical protein
MSVIAHGPNAKRTAPCFNRRPATQTPIDRRPGARSSTRIASLAMIGMLATLSLAACGSSGVNAQTGPTPSTSTVAPTPSHTPTPQTKSQQAGAAATAQVVRYERLLDDLFLHPRMSIDRLYTVSTQPDVNDEIGDLNRFREARDRQTGRLEVVATKLDRVDLANRPHARTPVYPTVRVTACIKVSGVQAHAPNGKSVVPKSRKPYLLAHLTMVNPKFPALTGWLVSRVTNREERSCGA